MNKLVNMFSLNIGTSSLLAGLPDLANTEHLDIIFLQEIRMTSEEIESLMPGFSAEANIDVDNPSRPGTAILWRNSLQLENVSNICLCTLQVATFGSYKLVNIYAPSGSSRKNDREYFYSQDLFSLLQLYPDSSWVWGGDHNCVLDRIDIENGVNFNQKKSLSLGTLVKAADLSDSFRFLYPHKTEFTFNHPVT